MTVSFAPFRVVALAHGAPDQVRHAEDKQVGALKHIRWGTLNDAANGTRKQIDQRLWLQRTDLQTARAWPLKQALLHGFACSDNIAQATALLDDWASWAIRCRPARFMRLASTIKKHRVGLLENFRSSLSNGFADGLNGRIQAAKARAATAPTIT